MRPRSVNFTALSIRFSSALRSRTSSPLTRPGRSLAMSMSTSSALPCARAASDPATESASSRGENGSSRSTSPVAPPWRRRPRWWSAAPDARRRPGSPRPSRARARADRRRAAARASARMPVSGVRMSWARPASATSMARGRARATARRRLRASRRFLRLALAMRAPSPARQAWHAGAAGTTSPTSTSLRISAGVTPCARNSRRPVACVDLDSLRPSASRISR